jgi:hypothetical protein
MEISEYMLHEVESEEKYCRVKLCSQGGREELGSIVVFYRLNPEQQGVATSFQFGS